jgi:hypothetical protein
MSMQTAVLTDAPPSTGSWGSGRETFHELVARLSHQSVVKHFDAYTDVPWDDPAFGIDPDDARWDLAGDDVLGGTAWYRAQPAAVRSRIGLHLVASFMKIGIQFEGVLKQGILRFTETLPNGAPEFRYAYHEIIEEAQHSLMFQEFVNRTGFDIPGLTGVDRWMSGVVVRLGRLFPELFFLFVLGGEEPIDHVQRRALARDGNVHPLLRRIMQIHVTEEARHLCFARRYLLEQVPALGGIRRALMAVSAPLLLAIMAQLMMRPPAQLIRTYGIPSGVIAAAYTKNPAHRANMIAALGKVRALCVELGLVTPVTRRLWQGLGIWA